MEELIITYTPRGYRVEFPHKPNASAIRGFHQIGMVWQKSLERVTWSIPAERIDEAVECIKYWYKIPVRVEAEPIMVKPQPKEFRVEGWLV